MIPTPFTILIDHREKAPFTFAGILGDADQKRRPLVVAMQMRHLATGDYTVEGLEGQVAVERKSLADLYATLGQCRARFQRELHRLAAYRFAAVVVEADWPTVLQSPPRRSRLNPKTVYRSVIAWQQRFPNTHWWLCSTRAFAEVTTFRILERAWKDSQKAQKTGRVKPEKEPEGLVAAQPLRRAP